jgi:hypothetical protein
MMWLNVVSRGFALLNFPPDFLLDRFAGSTPDDDFIYRSPTSFA